jgi:hypothetical protein
MGLIARAKADIERITSDLNGFATVLKFHAPTGQDAQINGRFTKITIRDPEGEGAAVDTKEAHISFSEKFLKDLAYPLRNAANQVHMQGHTVRATDSNGDELLYSIRTWAPDETVGLIVCELGDFDE